MADIASSKIINQIQAIVSDHLQVVSYKWLSRNFSVPSNSAKRLLQDFVEQYGDGLEVIYAISGWSKSEPQHYSVQLVPKAKLEEVKAQFVDACSTHVYSVQPCLPKDPAELWSAEFVQAEELFNQSTGIENCLRDNRFSAVSCSLVKYSLNGKEIHTATPVLQTELSSTMATDKLLKHHVLPRQEESLPLQKSEETGPETSVQVPTVETDLKTGSDMKSSSSGKGTYSSDTVKVPTAATDKKKGQNGKGTGGTLTRLWGRASSKPKPNSSPPPANDVKDVLLPAMNAEAQICALEAATPISSDDDAEDFSCIRRKRSNNGSGQKRRVVFNMSDGENEDEIFDSQTVVSLASPELPKQRPGFISDIEAKIATATAQEEKDIPEEQRPDKTKAAFPKKSMASSSKFINGNQAGQTRGKGKGKINDAADKKDDGATNLKENLVCPAEVVNNEHLVCPAEVVNNEHEVHTDHVALDDTLVSKAAIKKRKVVKTQIDDRGREVTEIAWEADGVELGKVKNDPPPVKKSSVHGHADNKPQTMTKGQSTEQKHPANRMAKINSKHTTKGAGKETRQGNILSFYKKA